MKFGLCLPIRRDCSLQFNIDLAISAEKHGFDSVWVSDHIVMPKKMNNSFSSVFYDPMVLLTAIAANTEKIKLGTSVIILPYRHPVVLAKMISTLDQYSAGRVIFGIATGWLKEEFEVLNADFNNRGKVTNEYIEAITELWSKDNPVFSGEFVSFSDIDFYPKPFDGRLPEIWVGGSSRFAVERAIKHANGWQPTWVSPEDYKKLRMKLIETASEMNIDTSNFTFSVRNRVSISGGPGDKESNVYMFQGSMDDIRSQVESFVSSGVEYIVFDPETGSDSETLEMVEKLSESVLKDFS